MVAEHVTGNGFSGALQYQEQSKIEQSKQSFEVIEQQGMYGNAKDLAQQMRWQAQERPRVQKPVGHLVVSFPPTERLTKNQEVKAVKAVMNEANITDTQYRMVKHNDKGHSHYHVIYNRVDNNAQLINDHQIKNRLQVACSKVEQEQGLQSHDKERTIIYDPTSEKGYTYQPKNKRTTGKKESTKDKRQGVVELRNKIREEISKAIQEKPSSLERFKELLQAKGINTLSQEREGKLTALSFEYKGNKVKASSIGIKAKEVQAEFMKNSFNPAQAYIANFMVYTDPNADEELREKANLENLNVLSREIVKGGQEQIREALVYLANLKAYIEVGDRHSSRQKEELKDRVNAAKSRIVTKLDDGSLFKNPKNEALKLSKELEEICLNEVRKDRINELSNKQDITAQEQRQLTRLQGEQMRADNMQNRGRGFGR